MKFPKITVVHTYRISHICKRFTIPFKKGTRNDPWLGPLQFFNIEKTES